MPDPGCVVCKIVAGELPARFLYADETVVSFLDIAPATPGHALVAPESIGVTYGRSKTMSWRPSALRLARLQPRFVRF